MELEDEEEDFDDHDDNDDRDHLTLRSWIREVWWAICAGGLVDQVIRSHFGARRMMVQKREQQRCDSENLMDEWLAQLKSIPHFPLFSASVFATNNSGDNENNDRVQAVGMATSTTITINSIRHFNGG